MKREIGAALFYLKRNVKAKGKVEADKLELFVERLAVALKKKFQGHWYPENPSRGSAYRCTRINEFYKEDPELVRACQESGVKYSDLGLPREVTLWVDPGEVCCRYGEGNLVFSVATFSVNGSTDEQNVKIKTRALKRVSSDSLANEKNDNIGRCCISKCQALNLDCAEWYPKPLVKAPVKGFHRPSRGFRTRSRVTFALKRTGWFHTRNRVRPVHRGVNCQG